MNMNQVQIIDAVLTGSLGLMGQDYIADKVAPPIFYNKESVRVPEWGKESMFTGNMRRAPGAAVSRQYPTLSNTPYTMSQVARELPLPDEYLKVQDNVLDLRVSLTQMLEDQFYKEKEIRFGSLFTNTANFGNDNPAAFPWDGATGVPITDINTGIADIQGRLGYKPNTLVMDFATWQALAWNDQIKDWRNITTAGPMSEADIAKAFGVDNLYVGSNVYNVGTDVDGQGPIMPIYSTNFCSVLYVDPKPGPLKRSWAYCLALDGYPIVETYREEQIISEILRYINYYDYAVVAPDCGYLITTTL